MAQQPDGTPPPVLLHALSPEVVTAEHADEVVVAGGGGAGAAGGGGTGGAGGFLGALPVDGADDASLRRNRAHLDGLRANGRYVTVDAPVLGVLVLERGDAGGADGAGAVGEADEASAVSGAGAVGQVSRTVAIVGDVDVAAYADGRVLPHEQVDDDRVGELSRYLDVVEAASSPVCVAHRPHPDVTAATAAVLTDPPTVTVVLADGTRSSLHLVSDAAARQRLVDAVAAAGQLYLADGHHRAAAVARCQEHRGDDVRVLTAVVPSDHLHVAAFHRRIDAPGAHTDGPGGRTDDPGGRTHDPGVRRDDPGVRTDDPGVHTGGPGGVQGASGRVPARVPGGARGIDAVDSLLRSLGLRPTTLAGPSTPDGAGIVHVVADGRWWRVDLRDRRAPGTVPELDVTMVERELVGPLQRLAGPGSTVSTSPAPAGLESLDIPGAIGLALHPPDLEDVFAAVDQGAVLPPKTTYLAPKLPAGLLVVPRPRRTDER